MLLGGIRRPSCATRVDSRDRYGPQQEGGVRPARSNRRDGCVPPDLVAELVGGEAPERHFQPTHVEIVLGGLLQSREGLQQLEPVASEQADLPRGRRRRERDKVLSGRLDPEELTRARLGAARRRSLSRAGGSPLWTAPLRTARRRRRERGRKAPACRRLPRGIRWHRCRRSRNGDGHRRSARGRSRRARRSPPHGARRSRPDLVDDSGGVGGPPALLGDLRESLAAGGCEAPSRGTVPRSARCSNGCSARSRACPGGPWGSSAHGQARLRRRGGPGRGRRGSPVITRSCPRSSGKVMR